MRITRINENKSVQNYWSIENWIFLFFIEMLHNYASAQNLEVAIGLNTIEIHVVSEFDLKHNFTLYVFSDFPAI